MPTRPGDFPPRVVRELAERVNYVCSNPDCRAPTLRPHSDGKGVVKVGEAAHIHSASVKGPRHDPTIPTDQLSEPDNGIYLCTICHPIADGDASPHPAELLRAWKVLAVYEATRNAGRPQPRPDAPPLLSVSLIVLQPPNFNRDDLAVGQQLEALPVAALAAAFHLDPRRALLPFTPAEIDRATRSDSHDDLAVMQKYNTEVDVFLSDPEHEKECADYVLGRVIGPALKFGFEVRNTGTRTATAVRVKLSFPDGFAAYRASAGTSMPPFNSPKRPRLPSEQPSALEELIETHRRLRSVASEALFDRGARPGVDFMRIRTDDFSGDFVRSLKVSGRTIEIEIGELLHQQRPARFDRERDQVVALALLLRPSGEPIRIETICRELAAPSKRRSQ